MAISRDTCAVFNYYALQSAVEGIIASDETRLLGKSLGQAFCAIDRWNNMTFEDVRAMEQVLMRLGYFYDCWL